jgi:hypothetical protein
VSSKCFQLYYTCSDRQLVIALPLALSTFFSSPTCDVSQALIVSYFASAVTTLLSHLHVCHSFSPLRSYNITDILPLFVPVWMGSRCEWSMHWPAR